MWESLLLMLLLLFIFAIIVLIVFVIWAIVIYNDFVTLRNAAAATFNQIKVALRKRIDMIAQLVEAVGGSMKFEKEVFEKVAALRSRVADINSPKDAINIHKEMNSLFGSIVATFENYPELKSTEQVSNLMETIKEMESEIARLRYTYNNIIQEYNTKTDIFPSNIVAMVFGFKKMEYLDVGSEEELEKRPKIDFNL